MRLGRTIVVATAVILLAACQGHESVTGAYGSQMLSGVVTMAAGMANSSPAGVRVSVSGTGMSTVLGADGRFSFFNVPQTAQMIFSRNDVNASLSVASSQGPLAIELTSNSAHLGRHHSSGTEPQLQVEGTIVTVSATQIVVQPEEGSPVTFVIDANTLIFKGDQPVKASDLQTGQRVHVKGSVSGNTNTALLIQLQDEQPSNGQVVEVEGVIDSASATQLVVLDEHGKDVTIAIDANTVIRKGDQTLKPSDLTKGERVHVKATLSGTTLTALLIVVQNEDNDNGSQTMTANGTVTAVGSGQITVSTEDHGDVVVKGDNSTIVRMEGAVIHFSDIKQGWQVNCLGTRIDDHTLQATQIEVRGVSDHP